MYIRIVRRRLIHRCIHTYNSYAKTCIDSKESRRKAEGDSREAITCDHSVWHIRTPFPQGKKLGIHFLMLLITRWVFI